MKKGKQFDAWSGWHFLGPYVLCDFSVFIAVSGFILWEVIDEIVSRLHSDVYVKYFKILRIWDREGASWGDLVCGVCGIALWFIMHLNGGQ